MLRNRTGASYPATDENDCRAGVRGTSSEIFKGTITPDFMIREHRIFTVDIQYFCRRVNRGNTSSASSCMRSRARNCKRLKVHKHDIILNFFLPKSNPYRPFVNFRKKSRLFSFDFRQNFDVRTFPR